MKEHYWHICPEQWFNMQWQSTLSAGNITSNSTTPHTNICGSYNQEGNKVSSIVTRIVEMIRSWAGHGNLSFPS
jgi:hypothetical protein